MELIQIKRGSGSHKATQRLIGFISLRIYRRSIRGLCPKYQMQAAPQMLASLFLGGVTCF
jgi:hypothetical protein